MDSHLDPDLALGSNVALHVSKKKRKQGCVSDQLAQLHLPPGPCCSGFAHCCNMA